MRPRGARWQQFCECQSIDASAHHPFHQPKRARWGRCWWRLVVVGARNSRVELSNLAPRGFLPPLTGPKVWRTSTSQSLPFPPGFFLAGLDFWGTPTRITRPPGAAFGSTAVCGQNGAVWAIVGPSRRAPSQNHMCVRRGLEGLGGRQEWDGSGIDPSNPASSAPRSACHRKKERKMIEVASPHTACVCLLSTQPAALSFS